MIGYLDSNNQFVKSEKIQEDTGEVGYLDIIGAAYRQENIVTSFLSKEEGLPSVQQAVSQDIVSDYAPRIDYTKKAVEKGVNPDYLEHYEHVRTDSEYAALNKQIEKETADRELISKAGTGTQFLAMMQAGITDLDPLMFVPAIKTAKTASKAVNVGADIAKFAAAGAVGGVAQEALLQETQLTRPDSYYSALVGGALLGGGLGGAVSLFRKSPFDIEALEKDLGSSILEENKTEFGISSASAAEVKGTTLAQEGVAGGAVTEKVAGLLAKDRALLDNPVLQSLTSPFKTTRMIAQQLAETTGLRIKKAEEGIAVGEGMAAIETLNKLARGAVAETEDASKRLWSEMLTGKSKGMLGRAKLEIQSLMDSGTMSYRDFQREVGLAMRNNDTHEVPQVQEMAKIYREKIFNPVKERAVKLDLLPEGVTPDTAASYFTRVYDIDKMIQNSDKFDDITAKWLGEQQDTKARIQDEIQPLYDRYKNIDDLNSDEAVSLRSQIEELAGQWEGKSSKQFKDMISKGVEGKKLDDAFDKAVKRIMSTETRLIDSELRYLAGEIRDRIISTPDGRLPYEKSMRYGADGSIKSTEFLGDASKPGMFKGRAFAISDDLIKDFLVNDADVVASSHIHRATPYMNMYERFNGDIDLLEVRQNLRAEKEEALRKLEGLDTKAAEKERVKINKAYENDVKSIVALRQRALGQDFIPGDPTRLGARIPQAIRTFNVVTLLGGMTVSAIPDLGRLVALQSSALNQAVKPFIKNFVTGNSKVVKAKFKELNYLGVVAELVGNNRVMQIGDIVDDYQPRTRLERGIQYLGDKSGITTLMAPWNETLKQIAAITTEHTILDIANKLSVGKATKEQTAILAQMRIDADMAGRISKQFNQYGEKHKGLNLLNAQDWDDVEAKRAFLAALTEEVDRVILTPGYDKSVMMSSSEMHKMLWQFKSFFAKSTTNILLRSMQDIKDLRNAAQFVTMTGLGMMVYATKTLQANRDLSDNPAVWLIEGFDRAGIGGIFMEANNTFEKGFGVGLRPMVGGGVSSRYASRSAVDGFLGPTYGQAVNLLRIGRVLGTQEMNEGDINAMIRMVPYQNHPLLLPLKNRLKESISN